MDAMELLLNRTSIAPRLHQEPAPSDAELGQILAAACRAPDHGRLRPWRFIVIRGEARARLGEVFAAALKARAPDASEAAIETELSAATPRGVRLRASGATGLDLLQA